VAKTTKWRPVIMIVPLRNWNKTGFFVSHGNPLLSQVVQFRYLLPEPVEDYGGTIFF